MHSSSEPLPSDIPLVVVLTPRSDGRIAGQQPSRALTLFRVSAGSESRCSRSAVANETYSDGASSGKSMDTIEQAALSAHRLAIINRKIAQQKLRPGLSMHIRYPSKSFDQCLSDWCDTVPEESPWCDTCDGGSLKGVIRQL